MNVTGLLGFVAYALVFFIALTGAIWWDRRKRKTRQPFPENLKLLRMPGEYLWRHVIKGEEADMMWWMAIMMVPIMVGLGVLQIVARWLRPSPVLGLVLAVVVFVFCLLLCVRWCLGRLQRRADEYLGFFGERYVAEQLDPLKSSGWFIFHDVQCEGQSGKFNLDHVAVGSGGVWVIETKTRRKGRTRPGFEEYKVIFDGQKVIWPWGEDRGCLTQASDNARWLQEWLETMTGKQFPVWPVLTFPGYHVTEAKLGPVRVVYTKGLQDVTLSRGKDVLRKEDVDLIRRQLEVRCRDVEY